jgi:exodeoxyribonuclease (lambda-induced)
MLQRSSDWFDARKGRFTASDIHKLLGVRGLGQTGESYIFEKAVEEVFGLDEEDNFVSNDMQRGITLEPLAFRKFKELKEFDFLDVQETTFFSFGSHAGASPDGLVGNDAILEIKCPRPTKFFNLVAKGIDAIDKEYIAQMQMQMLCTNSKKAYFFNYIIFNGKEMWHEIEVERDEKMIELIKNRIDEAIKIKQDFVQYLITNKQF